MLWRDGTPVADPTKQQATSTSTATSAATAIATRRQLKVNYKNQRFFNRNLQSIKHSHREQNIKTKRIIKMKLFSVLLLLGIGVCFGSEDSKNSDLDGSESNQSYGYGYGTKVADQVKNYF